MSLAKPIEAGSVHHVSRRCNLRRYLLTPDAEVRNLMAYCLAEGSARYGTKVLHLVIMGDHYHGIFFDEQGRFPEFLTWVHRSMASGIQRILGARGIEHVGSVFDQGRAFVDQLIEDADGLRRVMRYVGTNPVAAHLCPDPVAWPGMMSRPGLQTLDATRPSWMTEQSGPATQTLHFSMPPQDFLPDTVSAENYAQYCAEELAQETDALHKQMRQDGTYSFCGVKKAMSVSPTASPSTPVPRGNISARLAALAKAGLSQVRDKLKAFRKAYHEALGAYRGGDKAVRFPAGTWKMRVLFGCQMVASCQALQHAAEPGR